MPPIRRILKNWCESSGTFCKKYCFRYNIHTMNPSTTLYMMYSCQFGNHDDILSRGTLMTSHKVIIGGALPSHLKVGGFQLLWPPSSATTVAKFQ